jgi:phospholipid/cholesterol/gamma-HCH transport system substrate-binding protein
MADSKPRLSLGMKVGLVGLAVAVLGFTTFKSVSKPAAGADGIKLWGHFRDASGLADRSRVLIAGLDVGSVAGRRLEGTMARVTVLVQKDQKIYDNASIAKKAISLLGEHHLEIDPGTPDSVGPDGRTVQHRELTDGDQIRNVIESSSTNDILTQVGNVLPGIDETVRDFKGSATDARKLVNGPIAKAITDLEGDVAKTTRDVHGFLTSADQTTIDLETSTRPGGGIKQTLADLERGSADARRMIAGARVDIRTGAADIRAGLKDVDEPIRDLTTDARVGRGFARMIDEPSPDSGTLSRLVNDSTIYDNIEQITEDVKDFTAGLFKLKTVVGLRAEYNLFALASRAYVSVELWPKPDRFWLIELAADTRSGRMTTTLSVDDNQNLVRRQHFDYPGVRITFQFAKRFDWFTVRAGVKESTGGFGADADLFAGRAKLSLDVFQMQFDALPRVRATLAVQFWKHLYVMGGIDDLLNEPDRRLIGGNDVSGDLKRTYYFGREPFIGVMLKFTDEDLRSLLFIGGGAIGSLSR